MKDRSAPFSRKHRRYWLPVTGGMLLIGAINLGIGYCSWPGDSMDRTPDVILPKIPISEFARPDAMPATTDAATDATTKTMTDATTDTTTKATTDATTKTMTDATTDTTTPAPAAAPR